MQNTIKFSKTCIYLNIFKYITRSIDYFTRHSSHCVEMSQQLNSTNYAKQHLEVFLGSIEVYGRNGINIT